MASLENHGAALEDQLVPGLNFKIGPGSNYVLERKNVSFYPQGSNIYSTSNGQRVLRISLNSDQAWGDPSTGFLFFRCNNRDTTAQTSTAITRVEPLGMGHVFFKSGRLLLNGQVAEQIDDFGRAYELLSRLSPETAQKQYAAMSFGLQKPYPEDSADLRSVCRIPPGKSKTIAMPLGLFGIWGQHRFLPFSACNMVLELTLQDPALCCRGGTSTSGSVTTTFTQTNVDLDMFVLKMDTLVLDSQLQEEYNRMLLTKTLPISYKTWHHTSYAQTGNSSEVSVAFQRSVSRLCTVFVTFFSTSATPSVNQECNYFPHVEGQIDSIIPPDADHPLFTTDVTDDSKAVQWEFVCDGTRYPSSPCLTTVEAYTALVRALGFAGQTSHSIAIGGKAYETTDFCICENFEKVIGSALSGKNLRGGSQLLLHLKNMVHSGMIETDKITKIFLLCQFDAIAELSAQGVTILE